MRTNEITFDGWTLKRDSGELSGRGTTLRLPQQQFQILDELLSHPGEVVTREQLIARLWPRGVVDFETGLNSVMRKLRIALQDDASTPRYIETIPRRGYRFIHAVDAPAASASRAERPEAAPPEQGVASGAPAREPALALLARQRRARWLAAAAALLALALWAIVQSGSQGGASANAASIVILPFADLTASRSEAALAEGIAEELSNWLSHVPGLQVVARASASAFQEREVDAREIGRTLDVRYVLEGSVRRADDQVRVTAQLIDSRDGVQTWSRSFDLPATNVLRIEDAISRAVAEALDLTLSAATDARWAGRRSASLTAYDVYLEGRLEQRRRTPQSNLRARSLFGEALALDPQFKLASIGLAETILNGTVLNGTPLDTAVAEAEPLIGRVTNADPEMPELLALRGWLAMEQFRIADAIGFMERAAKQNPNDADNVRRLGEAYSYAARPDAALEQFAAAARLDRLDFMTHVKHCLGLVDLGMFEQAEDACARGRALAGDNVWGALATSWLEQARGNLVDAYRWIGAAIEIDPAELYLHDQKIDLLLGLGLVEDARRVAASTRSGRDSADRELLEAQIRAVAGDTPGLRAALDAVVVDERTPAGVLLTVARWRLVARQPELAQRALRQAQAAPGYRAADLADPTYVRLGYSAAIPVAAILLANGAADEAAEVLEKLDEMLAQMERHGALCHGLYSLRAESLALQNRPSEALRALAQSVERGWRLTSSARREPYLESLAGDERFAALLVNVEELNAASIARVAVLEQR